MAQMGVDVLSAMATYLAPVMSGTVGYAVNSIISTLNVVVSYLGVRASRPAQGGRP